jgi:ribonuclease P protein component
MDLAPLLRNTVRRPADDMLRLTKRSEYLKVARGGRTPRRGFLLQMMTRPEGDPGEARFGFTVTKKIGNAVVRNRIRRRLKEAVRLAGVAAAAQGTDYVLVGRSAALDQHFDDLCADVVGALRSSPRPRDGSGNARHAAAKRANNG